MMSSGYFRKHALPVSQVRGYVGKYGRHGGYGLYLIDNDCYVIIHLTIVLSSPLRDLSQTNISQLH